MDNFKFIAVQTVIVAVGALGMTLIVVSGGIDLSVGSTVALAGVVAAILLKNGHSCTAAIVAAIVTGGCIGLLNGSLISFLRIAPFIVTLGTLGVTRGMAYWFASEQPVPIPATWINGLMAPFPASRWLIVAPGVWLTLALAGMLSLMLRNTVFGRHIFAIGSNEATAILCGVRVRFTKLFTYVSAGLFFGLAGVLQMAHLRQGDPGTTIGLELEVIGAVIIGGASLNGGTGSVAGSLLGALIMTVIRNGSQQAGWPTYSQQIIAGCLIIIAVALDRFRHAERKG
jgi:ribose transport system permease protein